ncbi:MAG: hypothetical protein WA659_01015 [Candidatus Aquirickettsiella sp.]
MLYFLREMPCEQLADFLNETTNRDNNQLFNISEAVEKGILDDFSDLLKFEDNKYIYIGPKIADRNNFFPKSYHESIRAYTEQEDLLKGVNKKNQATVFGLFSLEESQAVLQHEVAITNSKSKKPILGSYGARPCVIVALYNPSTKEAVLAHIDALTTLFSLNQYFTKLSSNAENGDKIQVHLSGGDNSSKKKTTALIKEINDCNDTEIISANICNGNDSKSLAIDSRTGEIFTSFRPNQLQHAPDYRLRMELVSMQFSESALSESFDGTKFPNKVSAGLMFFSDRKIECFSENQLGSSPQQLRKD